MTGRCKWRRRARVLVLVWRRRMPYEMSEMESGSWRDAVRVG